MVRDVANTCLGNCTSDAYYVHLPNFNAIAVLTRNSTAIPSLPHNSIETVLNRQFPFPVHFIGTYSSGQSGGLTTIGNCFV
jgi:hypothetical protein